MNICLSVYLDACCFCRLLDDTLQYRVRLETEAVVTILECCDRGEMSLISSECTRIRVTEDF